MLWVCVFVVNLNCPAVFYTFSLAMKEIIVIEIFQDHRPIKFATEKSRMVTSCHVGLWIYCFAKSNMYMASFTFYSILVLATAIT